MAMNFPSNPQHDDEYNGFTYDANIGAWLIPNASGGSSQVYVSDTKPVNPGPNSLWWNSVDASVWLFYSDPDGDHWIEFVSSGGGGGASLITVQAPLTNTGTYSEPIIGINVGTDAGDVASATDPRLSDERHPLDNSVTTDKIVDGVITNSKVSPTAAIAQTKIANLTTDLAAKAPLESPALAGTPTAPTATTGTSSTQVATTAFVASSIADFVGSSQETLDTLNELAAALGNDPDFATTISTEIGTKVSKSGDTMTGYLTLSGSPTSNLHAATKSYVDSSISQEAISTLAAITAAINAIDSDDIAEGTANLYYTDQRVLDVTSTEYDVSGAAETAETNANSYTDTQISSKIPATVSSTEIGYLDGVSSSIQTQINSKAAISHTHNISDVTNLQTNLDTINTDIDNLQAADLAGIKLNINTISTNQTIPVGYNGVSAGPITIADGVTVVIPDGSAWSIV